MGNGDEKSGEPSKFIGRGALQLTGKNNYKLFSDFIGEDCVKNQIWLQLNTFKVLSSFDTNKLWTICKTIDDASITKLSKKINGGTNGLADRIDKTNEYYQLIK
jgi:putative chitinase